MIDPLPIIISELNRRIHRTTTKVRQKIREHKFQDQRIHEARKGALIEMLNFVEELKTPNPAPSPAEGSL